MLYNERGEVTETCLANIVIKRGGQLFTPAIRCGLLGGTFRRSLIDAGEVEEAVLTRDDVENAEQIFIVNSVRKWRTGQLI
jgi:para-aminobenzoate synthetase/4-amino-4-deoxychorismate lyase